VNAHVNVAETCHTLATLIFAHAALACAEHRRSCRFPTLLPLCFYRISPPPASCSELLLVTTWPIVGTNRTVRRDILASLRLSNGDVFEVQLGLQALYDLKEGLHQAYETLREAGVRPTHIGAATVSALRLARSGCLQKCVASGTAIAPEQRLQLVAALAAPQCRITVLELASCTGLEGQRLDELLSAAVCTALGTAGVTRIRLTGNQLAGSIATVLESLAGSCHRLEYTLASG
jgi:hypothetical protein